MQQLRMLLYTLKRLNTNMIYKKNLSELQISMIEGLIWKASDESIEQIEKAIATTRAYRNYITREIKKS